MALSRSMSKVGRNASCPCGSGLKYKKCCLERAARSTPAQPAASSPADRPSTLTSPPAGELTLIVDTPGGAMVRKVPSAPPLRTHERYGTAAETATQDAAAEWGMPDFVFQPETANVGSGRRELGDGILLVGDVGVVLQVKGRETPSDNPDRERSWLVKKSAQALRQANGTIRKLRAAPAQLTSLRGTTHEVDGNGYRWLEVVIIDHPLPPDDVELALDGAQHPAVILLRRDWEFLFDQLKSTHAVCQYFERVADEPLVLGHEPVRYYDLATADAQAAPGPIDPALAKGGREVSTPLLPMAPAALGDRPAHRMVRLVLEDVAMLRLTDCTEADRLRILGELDRLPVGHRALIGQHLIEALQEVAAYPRTGFAWRWKSMRGADGTHLAYGACNQPHSAQLEQTMGSWVQLRHHDVLLAGGDTGVATVAVLLTPPKAGKRSWDTTVAMVTGEPEFTVEDLRVLRELWPTPTGA